MKSLLEKHYSLAARFNALAIALILLTSCGITVFVVRYQIADSHAELQNRGASLAGMMAQNSEFGLYTEDKKSLQQLLDGTEADENVAYAAVLAPDKRVIVSRSKQKTFTLPSSVQDRKTVEGSSAQSALYRETATGQEYLDLLVPVTSASTGDLLGLGMEPARAEPKTIGYIQLGLNQDSIRARIRKFLFSTVLVTGFIVLAGVLLTVVMTRRISRPINHLVVVAREIADGKLGHRIEHSRTIEIAELASAIENMSANLSDMIGKISTLADSVLRVTTDIMDSPASVLQVVDIQKEAIEDATASISEVNKAIGALSTSAASLSESALEASASSAQLTHQVSVVADNAEVFDRTAQEAASSVEEMLSSIKEIARSIQALSASSEQTIGSLQQMNTMINDIRRNADESVSLSERVSAEASARGTAAVTAAVEGIEHVRESMSRLTDVITSLAKRSKEISSIVTVIDEVADQTGLLALNASILAAQAGQQGGSFAVVADEIKKLAERTSYSTKEIAKLITAVQTEAAASVRMAGEGTSAVDQGVKLVVEVNTALSSIQQSAEHATKMARAIQQSTSEEATVIRNITDAVRSQNLQVDLISRSTEEQTKGSKLIMAAIEQVKEVAHQVMATTVDQLYGSKRIATVSENVSTQAAQITAAIESQKRKSGEIVVVNTRIQKSAADLTDSAAAMSQSILALSDDARKLTEELKRFKTDQPG